MDLAYSCKYLTVNLQIDKVRLRFIKQKMDPERKGSRVRMERELKST